MDPIVTGGLISAGSSLLSNIFGNAGNRRAEKRAYERTKHFWNMQNQYNLPINQRKRLEEAGLSSALMYGNGSGSTGMAGKIDNIPSAEYRFDNPMTNMQLHQNIRTAQAQAANFDAQALLALSARGKNFAETGYTDARTQNQRWMNDILYDTKNHQADFIKEQARSIYLRNISQEMDNFIKDATKSQQVQTLRLQMEQARENLNGQRLQNEYSRIENQLMRLGFTRNGHIFTRFFSPIKFK